MADADTGEGRAASNCSTASPRRNAGAGPSEEPVGTVPPPRPPGRAGRTSVRAPVGTICPVYRTELAATPLARSARTASTMDREVAMACRDSAPIATAAPRRATAMTSSKLTGPTPSTTVVAAVERAGPTGDVDVVRAGAGVVGSGVRGSAVVTRPLDAVRALRARGVAASSCLLYTSPSPRDGLLS